MGKLSDILGNKEDMGPPMSPKSKLSDAFKDEGSTPELEDEGESKTAAGKAVMRALKSGDAEAFSEALSDFIQMC